jgi:hypothetical protein
MIAQAIEDFKAKDLKIETPLDLIRVIQMDLELLGEGDGSKSGMLDEMTKAISAGRELYEAQLKTMQTPAADEEQ